MVKDKFMRRFMPEVKNEVKTEVKSESKSGKKERLVAQRNVERLKKEGWTVVKDDPRDSEGRVLGVRTESKDLVLMSK